MPPGTNEQRVTVAQQRMLHQLSIYMEICLCKSPIPTVLLPPTQCKLFCEWLAPHLTMDTHFV